MLRPIDSGSLLLLLQSKARATFVTLAVAAPLAIAAGLAASSHLGPVLVALAYAAFAFVAILRWNRGVAVALLVLAVLNGLPFIDFAPLAIHGTFKPNDIFI